MSQWVINLVKVRLVDAACLAPGLCGVAFDMQLTNDSYINQ